MFRRKVKPISEVISKFLREGGLESPLLQKRIITAWDIVVGPTITRYTQEKGIRNQTLFVKISNPALRQDLSMMRSQLVKRLNDYVGSFVISDIRILLVFCVLYHILLLFLFGISKASAGLSSKWHSIISYCKNAVYILLA